MKCKKDIKGIKAEGFDTLLMVCERILHSNFTQNTGIVIDIV